MHRLGTRVWKLTDDPGVQLRGGTVPRYLALCVAFAGCANDVGASQQTTPGNAAPAGSVAAETAGHGGAGAPAVPASTPNEPSNAPVRVGAGASADAGTSGDAGAMLDAGRTASGDAREQGADGGVVTDGAAARPTRLTLDFTTHAENGRYAPHNGGAAWVEDESGHWVHTFELWIGSAFEPDLKSYSTAGGPNYTQPFGTMPPPDVITGATLRDHRTHANETWNLKDVNGMEVPDGAYRVVIELAESNTPTTYAVPFAKSGTPFVLKPADAGFATNVTLTME